jgi:hypothetical protein
MNADRLPEPPVGGLPAFRNAFSGNGNSEGNEIKTEYEVGDTVQITIPFTG